MVVSGTGLSYGAESVENAEFARSKRDSGEMNGTKSNLPYALRCVTGKDAKRASRISSRRSNDAYPQDTNLTLVGEIYFP